MTLETAEEILDSILATRQEELKSDALERLIRYARCRTEWTRMSPEERRAEDAARSRLHDSLIDSLNILSRAMSAGGEENHWRAELGGDRRMIGDFACLAHAILGIRRR